jgi:hypothetical protein
MGTPAETLDAWAAAHEDGIDSVAALMGRAEDDMRVQVRLVNAPLARLAEELAPPYYAPWPTDEPFPREAFIGMWRESNKHAQRVGWDLDPETLPLFEDLIAAIEQHVAEHSTGVTSPDD